MLTRYLHPDRLRNSYAGLVLGSAIVVVIVSLGTVAGMKLLGVETNAAIPAALAAVAVASYAAAKTKR